MSNKKLRILVTGATGGIGGALVRQLSDERSLEVAAAARTPEKAKGLGVPVVHLEQQLLANRGVGRALKYSHQRIRIDAMVASLGRNW
jgi:uncharacterized protein YbjT (DUF2867 family)